MSKHQKGKMRERMTRYVSRHPIESRLARYTVGHERLVRQAITRFRLAQYVARSRGSAA